MSWSRNKATRKSSARHDGAAPNIALRNLLVVFAGVLLAMLPHVDTLPWWITAAAAALIAWRTWGAWRGNPLPRRWLVLALAFGALIAAFLQYRTLFGRDAGVALMVILIALKLLELRGERDVAVLTFISYFLALTHFLFSQNLLTAAMTALALLVLTAGLIGVHAPRRAVAGNFRTAALLLAQGLPVMIALFVLFPRVDGPLWGLPRDAFAGVTGLSDSMSPGQISELSQSDAIAFRVKFAGDPPPNTQLYWRGPVLWQFDGRSWRVGRAPSADFYRYEALGTPVSYEVTLEPHDRAWLFALDLAAQVPAAAAGTGDYQLLSRQPVRQRIQYAMRSYTHYRATAAASPRELAYAKRLPVGVDARARALAETWRAAAGNDADLVARAVEFFRTQRFEYTLTPPLLARDSVDEFLFDTKQGFCEHFASAFVFLMRAAGVPARVVTGYQGGELNPVDRFFVVRQSDAHAWAEVWLGDAGWVRVDPTAAANPIRIESGMAAAMPAGEPLPLLARPAYSWLRTLRFNWEALGNRWNQWVIGYNPERQRDLLSRLGMDEADWRSMAFALLAIVGAILALSAIGLLRRRPHHDPAQKLWLAFCARLARAGLARRPSEGPSAFAARAAGERPERAAAVGAIASLYVDIRYGPGTRPGALAQLGRLVREFKP